MHLIHLFAVWKRVRGYLLPCVVFTFVALWLVTLAKLNKTYLPTFARSNDVPQGASGIDVGNISFFLFLIQC